MDTHGMVALVVAPTLVKWLLLLAMHCTVLEQVVDHRLDVPHDR